MNENTIERIGMALADRAYAYRLFHVALGAEPNAEELDVLASEQTRAVFGRLAGSDVAKAKRLATWDEGLKIDSTCSDALTRMVELCAVLGEHLANGPAYADAMKVAFNKLFMVPGGSYVYPWESPYLGKDATLFKESTLDVRERYAKYGFEAEMKGHFPEDHIAMMMQFLACLADESYEAFADGDDARMARSVQRRTLSQRRIGRVLPDCRIAARVCRVRRRFRRRVGCFGRAGGLTLWMRRSTLPHLTR